MLPAFDASKVRVDGPGVKSSLPASVPVSFTIDTREAGIADLDVVIQVSSAVYGAVYRVSQGQNLLGNQRTVREMIYDYKT